MVKARLVGLYGAGPLFNHNSIEEIDAIQKGQLTLSHFIQKKPSSDGKRGESWNQYPDRNTSKKPSIEPLRRL